LIFSPLRPYTNFQQNLSENSSEQGEQKDSRTFFDNFHCIETQIDPCIIPYAVSWFSDRQVLRYSVDTFSLSASEFLFTVTPIFNFYMQHGFCVVSLAVQPMWLCPFSSVKWQTPGGFFMSAIKNVIKVCCHWTPSIRAALTSMVMLSVDCGVVAGLVLITYLYYHVVPFLGLIVHVAYLIVSLM